MSNHFHILVEWYNGRVETKGTLWEERFRSGVVEGAGQALGGDGVDYRSESGASGVGARDYRWGGYGSAVAGRGRSKEGIQRVVIEVYWA